MIIAIVDFEVAPQDQAQAVAALQAGGDLTRRLKGNLNFRAFTNAYSNSHVGLMHEWAARADFEAYLTGNIFKDIGAKLRPMMTSAPISRRFDAKPIEEVIG